MPDDLGRLTAALADRYAIERELGAGGMALVFLARDLRHDRQVAVKVLRPELAAVIGAERFLNEIRVTANLQHPHILPLYDSGEARVPPLRSAERGTGGEAFLFYVMPFLEGDSLRDRLQREKQLPVADAVEIARAVASALDYAHRHGVIHRDIKPENILLHDGQAMVADFGIALALSQAGGTRLTETGLSIGTPQYMSPEQAMGDRELDARSDIYSLGAVLYEMLTGDAPYTGSTAQAIVAKVITEKAPPVTAARDTVPAHVEQAIGRALNKLPADRFATAAEFAEALALPGPARTVPTAVPAGVSTASRRWWLPAVPWPAVLLLAVVGVLGGRAWFASPVRDHPTIRFSTEVPAGRFLGPSNGPWVAISPDGSGIAVTAQDLAGEGAIYYRSVDDLDFHPLPGTEGARNPTFLPDGSAIAFFSRDSLRRVSLDEGAVVAIAPGPVSASVSAAWGVNDTIVYTPGIQAGLWRMAAGGGVPEQLTEVDTLAGEFGHWHPQWLPGGEDILFTAYSTPLSRSAIMAYHIPSGETTVVVRGGIFGRYVSTGHVLYVRNSQLLAVPFDVGSLTASGEPRVVLSEVAETAANGVAAFAIADNGTLAYVDTTEWRSLNTITWVDRTGREDSLPIPAGQYASLTLSPEGDRLAMERVESGQDIWTYDLRRNTLSRITRFGSQASGPLWTPDGRRLLFYAENPAYDLFSVAANGSDDPVELLSSSRDKYPSDILADGTVLFMRRAGDGDIWMMKPDGSAAPWVTGRGDQAIASVSPDGRWVAYDSDGELYVAPVDDPSGGRIRVSTAGGTGARWTRGGREIVFWQGTDLVRVDFDPSTGAVDLPAVVFSGPLYGRPFRNQGYDVTPDGERFIMTKTVVETLPRRVTVVLNWLDEVFEERR